MGRRRDPESLHPRPSPIGRPADHFPVTLLGDALEAVYRSRVEASERRERSAWPRTRRTYCRLPDPIGCERSRAQ
jgi:hypothetical protein